ncbi:unnamed protein product [Medioppia subpectinata]|uniref:ABC transporter domain-containing protein n=1 Tax=Medioppia subpectinata TaxID=1979941 RepID=A0A7R9KDY3_9ACAR|nr:unnamed protein product [Medioppia subpectinata]CAG2101395.1 unnamed protein product [Medioppia subpectinata]
MNIEMNNKTAIGWRCLTARVRHSSSQNQCILNEISGRFDFETINALMGSSGSGKTTLIKCLNASNRYELSDKSEIYVNKSVKIVSCFISQEQSDSLIGGLTVKEALLYAYGVKNSCHKFGVNERVFELMDELLLRDVCDNRIERCSGGERKRIAIALELTSETAANVMFLDEPTTGLDSNAAHIWRRTETHCYSIGVDIRDGGECHVSRRTDHWSRQQCRTYFNRPKEAFVSLTANLNIWLNI